MTTAGKIAHDRLPRPAPVEAEGTAASAPRTGLERTVLSVVRELLGDERIGPDDDFFAVGGNSLLAARLLGSLDAMLGVALPLHELLGNSTVRAIAAMADRDFSRPTATSGETARLVPVREEGSLPPLVLVARDGSTSLVLQHFLRQIDVDRPLWVLLRPMPPLGHRVPDLVDDARDVADVLLDRFPNGPVHLLGHSASGIVAVETARVLGPRRGAAVLLDTYPPSSWSATAFRHLADLPPRGGPAPPAAEGRHPATGRGRARAVTEGHPRVPAVPGQPRPARGPGCGNWTSRSSS